VGLETRSEMVTRLRRMLDGRTDLADSVLEGWIDQAYTHVCQPEVRRHRELETVYDFALTTATSEYDVSKSTVGFEILDLDDVTYYDATTISNTANKRSVDPVELRDLNRRTLSTYTGGPTEFAWEQDKIFINYLPSSSDNGNMVRMDVYREPAPLTTGTDVTVLGVYWDRALTLAARWFAQEELYGVEASFGSMQMYVGYVNEKADITQYGARDSRRKTGVTRNAPYQ